MSRFHTVRSLMRTGLTSMVLGVLLADTAAHATSAKLPGDFGPPREEPIHVVLVSPPLVPPPVNQVYPAKVIVEPEVVKKEMQISEGISYTFQTFGGTVPGSFVRVRQGDTVESHLKNRPSGKISHNIDLHDVTGPGDGVVSSLTAPGHESQFIFKALNEGVYIYHCATAPVGIYIANGMYDLILVEPPEGLPRVDHEYYVVQDNFYTAGKHREKGLQPLDMEKAIDERPSYALFNGVEGTLTNGKALHAKVSEVVCISMSNGGSNLVSSFHVISAISDQMYYGGGTNAQKNVQTTLILAGGAAVMKFIAHVPGSYMLVDHSIFHAFNKGAMVILKIDGAENKLVYSGKELDSMYLGDRTTPNMSAVTEATQASVSSTLTVQDQVQASCALSTGICSVCYQDNGVGLLGVFLPLAKSDLLVADPKCAVNIMLHGLNGRIKVNGQEYDPIMPPMAQLNGDEVVNTLTHMLNNWDSPGSRVNAEDVKKARAQPVPAKAVVKY